MGLPARRIFVIASIALLILPGLSPSPTAAAFPDVLAALSCADAVQQLTAFGVLHGYQDGTFGPGDPLLRAQAAATLVRAADWSGESPSQDFSDQGATDPELWRAVRILADRDVARGFPDGTFQPTEQLTRQQAISFVARMMTALGAWQAQATTALYADVAGAHAQDVATYYHYTGAVPQVAAANGAGSLGAGQTADRCWYAEALWGAARQLGRYQVPPPAPTAVPSPSLDTPTPLYWGAYINGVPWDMSLLDEFEARAGKPVSLVHWGQPWWHDGAYQPFQADMFDRVRAHGAIPLIDWASWDYCCGTSQPQFGLAAIARGDHDDYIRQWATGARDWGHPLFLRFDWEMNGWWQFPWSAQLNGNQSSDYVAAWRHVHDLFAQVGATNVTWVWCPNVVSAQTTPLDQLYPGDRYVDWVAMDGYNLGTDRNDTWRSFTAVFGDTYAALRKLAPGKPIMIAETASSEHGGDKAAWIRDGLGAQIPVHFPAIKAIAWFNWNDNDPGLSWPIESSGGASAAFGTAIGGSPWYLPNQFGNLNTSPIPPATP